MKVTPQDVAYVAELAQLELSAGEQQRLQRDLNQILEYVSRLQQLDTSGVPPMAQVLVTGTDLKSPQAGAQGAAPLRADETRPSLPRQQAMQNAPKSDGVYFKVPKVIER